MQGLDGISKTGIIATRLYGVLKTLIIATSATYKTIWCIKDIDNSHQCYIQDYMVY